MSTDKPSRREYMRDYMRRRREGNTTKARLAQYAATIAWQTSRIEQLEAGHKLSLEALGTNEKPLAIRLRQIANDALADVVFEQEAGK